MMIVGTLSSILGPKTKPKKICFNNGNKIIGDFTQIFYKYISHKNILPIKIQINTIKA